MIIKIFKFDDEILIEQLKDKIEMAINQKKINGNTYVRSLGMTNFNYFTDDKGKEVFNIFKKKYLSEYSIYNCWGIKYKKGEYSLKHNHWKNQGMRAGPIADVSGVIYLNDSKTGLYFNDLNIVEKAEKGKVIIFSSDTSHSVPKVEENDRYILSFNAFKKFTYDRYRFL